MPPLLILSIERKQLHDESVNLGKCQHLALRVLDRHGDQRDQAGKERILRGCFGDFLGTVTEWLAVQKTCSLSIARSTAAVGKAVSTQSTESVSISVPPNCSSEKDLSKSAEIKLRSPSKKFGAD